MPCGENKNFSDLKPICAIKVPLGVLSELNHSFEYDALVLKCNHLNHDHNKNFNQKDLIYSFHKLAS